MADTNITRRLLIAVSGLEWGGNIIESVRSIEAPAAEADLLVAHDYVGFASEEPHHVMKSTPDHVLWSVDAICGHHLDDNSILAQASMGQAPADLPWLFKQVLEINADTSFPPVDSLIVLTRRANLSAVDDPVVWQFKDSGVRSLVLVRTGCKGQSNIAEGKNYAAIRQFVKAAGGSCVTMSRSNMTALIKVVGQNWFLHIPPDGSQPIPTDFSVRSLLQQCDLKCIPR